jgi:CRP-like cAMP-binding protein
MAAELSRETSTICVPLFFLMTEQRKRSLSEKSKALSAAALAKKIGYLRIEDLPHASIFEDLPTESFNPHRIIRCKNELLLIKHGLVEIWNTNRDYMVKELQAGALFGELTLLGQAMLGTKAIVGSQGATVAVMSADTAKEWVKLDPISILEKLGRRLTEIEAQHYRASFQQADSRVAAVLLELAGEGSTVEGISHDELGEQIGVYRETATYALRSMKAGKLIEIGRKRITILDRKGLQELSEL